MTETQAPLFSDSGTKTPEPVSQIPAGHSVVRLNDGSLVVVNNDEIKSLNAAANEVEEAPEEEREVYLHLADGSTERVKESEIPAHCGTNAPHGFFKRDGYVFLVTGVYPVETKG